MDDDPRMRNYLWLVHWSAGLYPGLLRSNKEIAIVLGIDEGRVTRLKYGKLDMRPEEMSKLIESCRSIHEKHPNFLDVWLTEKEENFARNMIGIGYGVYQGPLDLAGWSSKLPPLTQAEIIQEESLSIILGRAAMRGDLGGNISFNMPISGSVGSNRRFGIAVPNPDPELLSAILEPKPRATTLLLYKSARLGFFTAAPCPQEACLHVFTYDWQRMDRACQSSARKGSRAPRLQLLIAKTEVSPSFRRFGFKASNVPERIELVLLVFGRVIPELAAWSEKGGEATPEMLECLQENLFAPKWQQIPRLAGRLLIDIIGTGTA